MAKRIFLFTTKALLTVLLALHSLPWAYDSRPSDYHLNISFPPNPEKKKEKLADLLFRRCRASGYSPGRGKAGCRQPSQACRSIGGVLSGACHRSATQVDTPLLALWSGFVTRAQEKLQSSRKFSQPAFTLTRREKCQILLDLF